MAKIEQKFKCDKLGRKAVSLVTWLFSILKFVGIVREVSWFGFPVSVATTGGYLLTNSTTPRPHKAGTFSTQDKLSYNLYTSCNGYGTTSPTVELAL